MARSPSKPIMAGMFAALLLGGTMLSTSASAGTLKLIYQDLDDDGTVTELWKDQEDGVIIAIITTKDGDIDVVDPGNPNPEDTATGPGSHSDKPDVVAMIKSGDATFRVRIVPADSPELLGHLQSALDGAGLGPHYNPSDDDNGHGPGAAPTHGMGVKKTSAEIRAEIAAANEVANDLSIIEASMGEGDEGGTESATGPNKNGNGTGKGPGDDEGNYTEGQDKDVGKTEKDLLGPKPEFVNPPHFDRTSTGDGSHAATGGGNHAGGLGGGAHNSLGGAHG